jgi:hypothetical protein
VAWIKALLEREDFLHFDVRNIFGRNGSGFPFLLINGLKKCILVLKRTFVLAAATVLVQSHAVTFYSCK